MKKGSYVHGEGVGAVRLLHVAADDPLSAFTLHSMGFDTHRYVKVRRFCQDIYIRAVALQVRFDNTSFAKNVMSVCSVKRSEDVRCVCVFSPVLVWHTF